MTKRRKNPNLVYVPIVSHRIVKNPKTLWPVNWEEVLGEDKVTYEDDPIFDDKGNYIETKRNVYVAFEQVKFVVRNRNKVNPNYGNKKLFETYSDRKEDEENE